MQFIVIAHDGTDEEAQSRRAAARPAHLEQSKSLQAEKRLLHAAAILNKSEQMIGSIMVFDFPSQSEFDSWLAAEPYVRGNVWQKIEVHPAKVGPSFLP